MSEQFYELFGEREIVVNFRGFVTIVFQVNFNGCYNWDNTEVCYRLQQGKVWQADVSLIFDQIQLCCG